MKPVAPFLLERLDRSSRILSGSRRPNDDAVHLARKRLKEARAALRLLHPVLGLTRAAREESVLRRAARRLSPLRDARVVSALLARLRPAGLPAPRLPAPRPDWRRSGVEIASCRRRLGEAFSRRLTRKEALKGLNLSRRQARRRFRAARRAGVSADLHALRKSVKRLRVQLDLLDPGSGLGRDLGRLARLLGRERDLALLLRFLSGRSPSFPWMGEIARRAERRRALLARSALSQARVLKGRFVAALPLVFAL